MELAEKTACPQCGKTYVVPRFGGFTFECSKCRKLWKEPVPGEELPDRPEFRCSGHPGRSATWACDACLRPACAACTTARTVGQSQVRFSNCCNEAVLPAAPVHRSEPIRSNLLEVLLYPLRPKGLAIFAILLVGLSLPLVSWVLMLLLTGYLAWILRTSAEGGKYLPDLPEFRDVWDGIGLPLLLLGFSLAVALTPLILYVRYREWDPADPVAWILCCWAVGVLPIVAMVTAVTRSIFPALNPVNLIRIVGAIPYTYTVLVLYVALLVLAVGLLRPFLTAGPLAILRLVADLYVLFVIAHLLGRAIHETHGKVEWMG